MLNNRPHRFTVKPIGIAGATIVVFFLVGSIANLAVSGYQRHLGQAGFVQEVRVQVLGNNNSAVAGAEVALLSYGSPDVRAITDASGTARFPEMAVGAYTLTVNAVGKEVYRDQFEIRASDGLRSSIVHVLVPMRTRSSKVRRDVSLNELRAPQKAQKDYAAAVDLIRKQEYEKALWALDEALAIYPAYAKAHNARGVVLGMMDRLKESEASLVAAIRYDENFTEPHFNLGKLLLELGQAPEAKQELQKAVGLQSSHMPAIELLIDAMLTIHDETAAVSLVRSLHTRGLEHPAEFHLEIATELERHGMSGLATEQYSLSFQDHPSEAERRNAEVGLSRTQKNN